MSVSHPIFARLYGLISASSERAGGTEHRRETLAGLRGRVIEVGAGSGLNFAHYPHDVTEVVAVEPEPYLRDKATKAAAHAPVTVTVIDGEADHLPADDQSFDAGVASLVLCSVPSQAQALSEAHRVIRPGGELRFYEHIRADAPRWARLQDRADHIWPFLFGGCHPNRNTVSAIEAAGFMVESQRCFLFQPFFVNPVAPHVIGYARRL